MPRQTKRLCFCPSRAQICPPPEGRSTGIRAGEPRRAHLNTTTRNLLPLPARNEWGRGEGNSIKLASSPHLLLWGGKGEALLGPDVGCIKMRTAAPPDTVGFNTRLTVVDPAFLTNVRNENSGTAGGLTPKVSQEGSSAGFGKDRIV